MCAQSREIEINSIAAVLEVSLGRDMGHADMGWVVGRHQAGESFEHKLAEAEFGKAGGCDISSYPPHSR